MRLTAILLGMAVVLTLAGDALAEPVRSNGGACDSTGTARKDGKDQNGNKMNCQWDTCTYSECSTSGGTVSNCVKKTEYSNPTDCHAAAAVGHGGQSVFNNTNIGVQQQPGAMPPNPTHKPPFGTVKGIKGLKLQGGTSTGGSGVIQ